MMRCLLTSLCCLLLSSGALAYDPLDTKDNFRNAAPEEPWQEQGVKIPDHLRTDDLQEFMVGGRQDGRFRYFIERGSLDTGDDWVTRFVLVIRSNRGAVNSSYEGLRCGHGEYKVYAYGDGERLSPMPGAGWQAVPKRAGDYRATLYNDLVCNLLTGRPNPPDAVFNAMQNGRPVVMPFVESRD